MVHYSDCDCGGWELMCKDCQTQLEQLNRQMQPIREVYEQMTSLEDFYEDQGLALFRMEKAIKKALGK